jgi:hypothetical protein
VGARVDFAVPPHPQWSLKAATGAVEQTDLFGFNADVRLWHKADIPPAPTNVRYRSKADMTRTGRYVG